MPTIGDGPGFSIDTILFATDFSPASKGAALYAAGLSRHFATELLIVHVFTASEAAMEVEIGGDQLSQQRKGLQKRLEQTAKCFPSGRGEAKPVLLEGDPKEVIPKVAEKEPATLLVMGTHGGNSLERRIIGSTAEGCLRRTTRPALTVGPHVKLLPKSDLHVSRILYATDCSPAGARAALLAVRLAEAFDSEIDVLNVVRDDDFEQPGRFTQLGTHFSSLLKEVVPDKAGDFSNRRTFVRLAQAHEEILAHIQRRSIDLLVLGVRRDAHLGMQVKTSEAFRIIVEAACPVLTVADCCV